MNSHVGALDIEMHMRDGKAAYASIEKEIWMRLDKALAWHGGSRCLDKRFASSIPPHKLNTLLLLHIQYFRTHYHESKPR